MNVEAPDWVTIRTYLLAYEAVFARDLLEAHGVHARVLDDAMVGVAPHLSNAIGGVRLQVNAAERKDALAILAAPHVVPDPVMNDDEPDEAPPARFVPVDSLARRAFVAAILGMTVVPLIGTAVSVDALLSFLRRKEEPASRRARILAGAALTIDLLVVCVALAALVRRLA